MISIIVPVYNVEQFLTECIESVLRQTFKDWELILVNDGSLDDSGKICNKYLQQDKRIFVIHKENGGLSDARNIGIESASGEYVMFLDSDDCVDCRILEILFENISITNADISMCNFKEFALGEEVESHETLIQPYVVYEKKDFPNQIHLNYKCMVVAWNKLYKKKIFSEIRYPVGRLHEDEFIILDLLEKCTRLVYTDQKLYFYLQRKESISHNIGNKNIEDIRDAMFYRLERCKQLQWKDMYEITLVRILHTLVELYKQLKGKKENKSLLLELRINFVKIFCCVETRKHFILQERVAYYLFFISPHLYFMVAELFNKFRRKK